MIGGAFNRRIIYEVLTAEPQGLSPRCGPGVDCGASLMFAACGGGGDTAGSEGSPGGEAAEPVAVTLITKTSTNPFFIAMQKGAEEAGKANNVTITTAAGKEDGDEATQIQAIEAAIARGDSGILITPATDGVNPAITQARDAGLYRSHWTPRQTRRTPSDITFATDNLQGRRADRGSGRPRQMDGQKANIAMLDLFNDRVASVDYNRDQGFWTGMGIDVPHKTKNGDEAPSGKYTGGKGGDYTIVCNEPTQGAQDGGKTAMENCLSK